MKRVSIVGLGFVGLSTAVYLASKGYHVKGAINEKPKEKMIKAGAPPFYEFNLEPMLKKALKNGVLSVHPKATDAVLDTDVTFVTVGTPSLPDGNADLSFVKTAAQEIGVALRQEKHYHIVVVKSTVPPGTTEKVVKPIIELHSKKQAGKDFGLAMMPEFLREGSAIFDVSNPDRIVIGEFDKRTGNYLEKLNRALYGEKAPILRMSLASSELSKYASNAFLATKVSFMNQIANICERINGVDVVEIADAMGLDNRIGRAFLNAGAGWGGSCFPKDTKSLVAFSKKLSYTPKLIEETISINTDQAKHMIELVEEELGNINGKRIALLGLSFKPCTDDIREAASLKIIDSLVSKGATVVAFDPMAIDNVQAVLGNCIIYAKTIPDCLENADCCLLLTEWDDFKKLQPDDFVKTMKRAVLIDGRRIYNPKTFSRRLKLRAIGLGSLK